MWWHRLGRWLTYALLALIALAAVGRVVRDRSAGLALLLYLPVLLIGPGAVAYDVARRGRALPRGRFLLGAVGVLAVVFESVHMIGWRGGAAVPAAIAEASGGGPNAAITLVHWNVQWGGSRRGTDRPWERAGAELRARRPDVVVLSEAPPAVWVREWLASMGPGWSAAWHDGSTGAKYRSQLAVCARWPVRHERDVRLPNGAGLIVRVDVPAAGEGGGALPLRVFVVDGRSGLGIHRTPLLAAVARACDDAARAGEPIDVIAGDFNAVSRSVGFDLVRGSGDGYALASEHAGGGWRGTFPSFLPLYDIDHVLVRRGVSVLGCELFALHGATDHRAQVVRLER